MVKVRMIVRPTGLLNGKLWPEVGGVIDLPDVAAVDLLNAGFAEAVKAQKVETATPKADAETATRRKG